MKTFIANFGRGNYLWPLCLNESTIAMVVDADLRPFWESGDRDGYIAYAIANKKSAAGITPTKPVASRWFNLATVVSETQSDLWIHREKDELWWAVTTSSPVRTKMEPTQEPERTSPLVYILQKQTTKWSNKSKTGSRLVWTAIHPRAREFLFTEGTLQQLSDENARYALALLEGEDLSPWHSQAAWKAKEEKSGRAPVVVYSATKRAAYRMATMAMSTAATSNGQDVTRTLKNKEFRFGSESELQEYLEALLVAQDHCCAITSLPLGLDGECADMEMLCSLDRIDSDGHYETGNLQVVCRFVNRWKSDSSDAEFRRLIRVLQSNKVAA
jgi:hypothetical protein